MGPDSTLPAVHDVKTTAQSLRQSAEENGGKHMKCPRCGSELDKKRAHPIGFPSISKAKLGAWGELQVQRDLLLLDIDSAHMTTDTGVDLVAYTTTDEKRLRFTIQVKTRTPRGNFYSWGVEKDKLNDADIFALVMRDVSRCPESEETWYLTRAEFQENATDVDDLRRLKFRRGSTPTKTFSCENSFSGFKGLPGLRRCIAQLVGERRDEKRAAAARAM